MAGPIDSSGTIETFCHRSDAPISSRHSFSFDDISVGDRVQLCFYAGDDAAPPFALTIRSPTGAVVLERIVRDLPTGRPQSAPPIELVVAARGSYVIDIREQRGRYWGKATLRVG
jgi:hypothetical protein